MTIGYIRVSTEGQDDKGQEHRIYEYANGKGYSVDNIVKETISSRKARKDRKITKLVEMLNPGDRILVTELSRLGRSSITEVGAIIEAIRDKGAGLSVVNEGIDIEPGKDIDLKAQAVLSALLLAGRIERDMISERTKSALQARKAQGVKLGRPEGSKLDNRVEEIDGYLEKGISKASIAKLLDVSRPTLYAFLNKRNQSPKTKPTPKVSKPIKKTENEEGLFTEVDEAEEKAVVEAIGKAFKTIHKK